MINSYEKRGYLLEDFRLFHLTDAPERPIDYHYHEFHKILMLRSGNGSYYVDGNKYDLIPGDLVLIGSQKIHKPKFDSSYERVILYISPDFIRQASTEESDLELCFSGDQSHVLRLPENKRKDLFHLAAQLEQELSGKQFGRDIVAKGLVTSLLVEIGRNLRSEYFDLPSPMEPQDERIAALLQYISDHIAESLSIDALAEEFFMSKYHMMHLFRAETGTTIHNYITERRLVYAKSLISQGMKAATACYKAGFQSYSSFTRAYGKRFGSTPTGRKDPSSQIEETYE